MVIQFSGKTPESGKIAFIRITCPDRLSALLTRKNTGSIQITSPCENRYGKQATVKATKIRFGHHFEYEANVYDMPELEPYVVFSTKF